MALLTLNNVGKIYVSENNVAVGIRGVNLSFDKGEFVAVTGKSGSGKSTLLNVISGMDTYEEGDLLIEGASTAHYQQEDWERYRNEYISFIFQDYNIIESFTVLQNVELALMQIPNPKERRRRAIELLNRVGLGKHLRQKGSKLSGGQKQRTVIARALAKDSPIILADEPTGNLDSQTSKEIVELLHEVSEDKLLIVVTHNYDEVEAYATRHIRIYDGAVESDETLCPPVRTDEERPPRPTPKKHADFFNGIALGRAIFTSKPKLSVFLCLLLLLGTAGVFSATSVFGSTIRLFEKTTMFTHIDGRLVVTKRTGEALTNAELQTLAERTGASDYLHNDSLLDEDTSYSVTYTDEEGYELFFDEGSFSCKPNGISPDVGRLPDAPDEILIHAPISYQPLLGDREISLKEVHAYGMTYQVVGVSYYYDNNIAPTFLLSTDGFRVLTAAAFLNSRCSVKTTLSVEPSEQGFLLSSIKPSFDIPSDKAAAVSKELSVYLKKTSENVPSFRAEISVLYYSYNYDYYDSAESNSFTVALEPSDFSSAIEFEAENGYYDYLIVGTDILLRIVDTQVEGSYRQGSLFYASDAEAKAVAKQLNDEGYIAVTSDTAYSQNPLETFLYTFLLLWQLAVWFFTIVFLAFFIHLCSGKTVMAFREDMAIMRSMGIPVKTIRVGIYVRMLISLIPGYLFVMIGAFLVFTSPIFNAIFTYLYFWQYLLIFVGMLILTFRVTKKQIHKLFSGSVKESIRGGDRG